MALYTPLSQDDVERIHLATMEVLERVGVLVENDAMLELLDKAGANVDKKGRKARIPEYVLKEGIKKAPSSFVLSSRRGKKNRIGGDKTVISSGAGASWILDLDTGEPRPATKNDVALMSRLNDALENLDLCFPTVIPQDVTSSLVDVHSAQAMMLNTSKSYYAVPGDGEQARYIIEMASIIAGGLTELQKNPILLGAASPNSPLRLAPKELDVAREFVEHRLPIALLNCPSSGAGSPISLAGTLVTTCAECLSLALIVELIGPGNPISIGCSPTIMDMRTANVAGGPPEGGLLAAGIGQMARHYNLPSNASVAHPDSIIPDAQVGYEIVWTALLALMAGVNLLYGPGLLGSSNVGSYEKLVIDNEVLGGLKRIIQGIEVSDDSLALDVIEAVGPGGHFLSQKHTRELLLKERWFPKISNRMGVYEWKKERLDLWQKARKEVKEILSTHKTAPLEKEKEEMIRDLVEKAEGSTAKH